MDDELHHDATALSHVSPEAAAQKPKAKGRCLHFVLVWTVAVAMQSWETLGGVAVFFGYSSQVRALSYVIFSPRRWPTGIKSL